MYCDIPGCPHPVVLHYHHAQGVTLLCEYHMMMWLYGKSVEPERKPSKRGPYKKEKL